LTEVSIAENLKKAKFVLSTGDNQSEFRKRFKETTMFATNLTFAAQSIQEEQSFHEKLTSKRGKSEIVEISQVKGENS
jgi:hypothetical protein